MTKTAIKLPYQVKPIVCLRREKNRTIFLENGTNIMTNILSRVYQILFLVGGE